MSEFYYGLPQPVWDNLCSEAEDLLYENKIGQHILGLYPAGDRIFGEESSSPGLLVLYMDSVDSLIDPFNLPQNKLHKQSFYVGNGMSTITYVDAFMWVHWHYLMANDRHASMWCPLRNDFSHMIPFGKHMIYEDPSFSAIVNSVADFSIKGSYYPIRHRGGTLTNIFRKNRAEAIIAQEKIFSPCMNLDWDEEIILKGEEKLLENQLHDFYLHIIKSNQTDKKIDKKKVEEVRKMVMDLYRFQL